LNSGAGGTNDTFLQGIELGRDGEFPEATAAFEKAAQAHPAVGTYINLGLSEWNRGHAGTAILAWEKARWIDPRDARAIGNLAFARQVAEVDTPQLKWFEEASTWLPPNDWVWIAGASLWLAVGALVLPRILRRNRRGWQQTLTALGLGAFLFSVTANVGVVSRTNIGFVVKKTAPLLLTPTREGEVVSSLNAGEPGRRLRARGNYYYIRTAGGAGWIEKSDFGLVCDGHN
jgi:tetratricopeptide (TPR) repeat protein